MQHERDDLELRDKLRGVGEELEAMRLELPEGKTERIQIRVTPTEKAEVKYVTDLMGVSESVYLMHLHRRAMRELDKRRGRRVPSKSSQGRRPYRRGRRRDGDDDGTVVGAKL